MGPPPARPLGPRGFLTDQEKQNKVKADPAFLKRIFSYLKPYKKQIAVIFIINILYAGIGLLPSIITAKIVDEALYQKNMHQLLILIVFDVVTLVSSGLIFMAQRYMNSWLSQQVIYDMKNQMYEHLQKMSHSFFTTERQGDVITRMTSDIEGVQTVITDTLTTLVSNILVVATTVAALFSMSWQLALVGIIMVPLLQIPAKSVSKKRWMLLKAAQEKNDELNQQINETLSVSGSMLVKLYNREDQEMERFRKINRAVTDITLKEQGAAQRFFAIMHMFTQFGPVLIYLVGGILLIAGYDDGQVRLFSGTLTVGTIIAVVALINRLYNPVSSLLDMQVNFTRSFALFERIFAYYDRKIDIQNCANPVKRRRISGDIAFLHVNFAYRPEKPILKDVNFVIPKGCSYALVGPSGAGKTTITNLIPRLFDTTEGMVSIDGIDVRKYDLDDLRRSIGIVTQDTYLFNGTIRENLLYAKSDATEEELTDACKKANIYDFIMSLPEQFDSLVGNRGLKLSGGEKQRVSIARVILKNPEILILDEATSSLDSISENYIQDAVEPLLKGHTSLIIAHRLSTVLSSDRILVVQDGQVLEQGTHRELLKNSAVYRELYETQFRRALDEENKDRADN